MNQSFATWFLLLTMETLSIMPTVSAKAQAISPEQRQQFLDVLTGAVASSDRYFVRVHAAENLVANGHFTGLDTLFATLQQQSPDQFVGATRVLARVFGAQAKTEVAYKNAISQLVDAVTTHAIPQQRLVALESLAKLGFAEPLPFVREQAQTGTSSMKAMARWVLANGNKPTDEAALAALLSETDPLLNRYAAYAFRYRPSVQSTTYEQLEACAKRMAVTDPQRVYLLSALFVHGPKQQRAAAWTTLAPYVKGQPNERYEVAEALSRRGSRAEVPVLQTLLTDADEDVRVAAANALLLIDKKETK